MIEKLITAFHSAQQEALSDRTRPMTYADHIDVGIQAVLDALQDPTDAMIEAGARAGCAAFHYAPPRSPDGAAKWRRERTTRLAEAPAAFKAMIKAAGEEG